MELKYLRLTRQERSQISCEGVKLNMNYFQSIMFCCSTDFTGITRSLLRSDVLKTDEGSIMLK